MTGDLSAHGLGALPDAPDERDYPLSSLYASVAAPGGPLVAAPSQSYVSPAL